MVFNISAPHFEFYVILISKKLSLDQNQFKVWIHHTHIIWTKCYIDTIRPLHISDAFLTYVMYSVLKTDMGLIVLQFKEDNSSKSLEIQCFLQIFWWFQYSQIVEVIRDWYQKISFRYKLQMYFRKWTIANISVNFIKSDSAYYSCCICKWGHHQRSTNKHLAAEKKPEIEHFQAVL